MTNSEDVWADDLLNRRADAEFLQAFLVGRMKERKEQGISGSYVLNIDAQWGAGKTFFLDRFAAELERGGHVVARVNAWRDDHADEPFISVMAAIDSALAPFVKKDRGGIGGAWEAVKQGATPVLARAAVGAGKTLIKRYVGMEAEKLLAVEDDAGKSIIGDAGVAALEGASIEIERVIDESASKLIDAFVTKNKAAEEFRVRLGGAMEALSDRMKLPLFILVDELDRCRPSYAVALLERVKHLFDADNVVFVFATNNAQLKHSIRGAYGSEFDGYRYLKRFFDRTFALPSPSPLEFIKSEVRSINVLRIKTPKNLKFEAVLSEFAAVLSMDLREIRHVCGIVESVATAWTQEHSKIEVLLLLPLAIHFYRHGTVEVDEVARSIPQDMELELGRQQVDSWTSRPIFINVRNAFERLSKLALSLAEAFTAQHNATDHVSRYIAETFMHEWNNRRVEADRYSVQMALPMLVETAGAFQFDVGDEVV